MAVFKIKARNHEGTEAEFIYDNMNSTLTDSEGNDLVPMSRKASDHVAFPLSVDNPAKKRTPRKLKISLGLSCNYSCEYCSQRFVPHSDETNKKDIQPFIDGLDNWVKEPPEVIEFWGGEPLVYIKTLKPLAEALRAKYPDTQFSMVTNGSLLNPELNDWLVEYGFSVGISHDAMGQPVRGPDPFEDDEAREGIIDLYRKLKPMDSISFNTVLHKDNASRADIQQYWVERFGESVVIGEGSFIDPYDEGGAANSLNNKAEQIAYRIKAFEELRTGRVAKFYSVTMKMRDFMNSLSTRRSAWSLGQKCGMDEEDNIAVDLNGNVLTCQNVSAVSTAMNGQPHKIGHVDDFENIKLNTSTHWSNRPNCKDCPVLQLCKGSCMFLEGDLWYTGCNNAYNDNVPFLAGSIEAITGFKPYFIDGEKMPEERKDLWTMPEPAPGLIPTVSVS